MASVDRSANRTARGVEDVIADVSQLIFTEGLFQRICFLLTLAGRNGQEHIKRRPQLLLSLWIATNPAPDQGGTLLQRRHYLLLRARRGVQIVSRSRSCYRYGKTAEASRHTQMPTKTSTYDAHSGQPSRCGIGGGAVCSSLYSMECRTRSSRSASGMWSAASPLRQRNMQSQN